MKFILSTLCAYLVSLTCLFGTPVAYVMSESLDAFSVTDGFNVRSFPPANFMGAVCKKGRAYKLKMTWELSDSSDIVKYEIYSFSKLLTTISSGTVSSFTTTLHPGAKFRKNWKKYKAYLESKYKILSVNKDGVKSAFVPIQMQ